MWSCIVVVFVLEKCYWNVFIFWGWFVSVVVLFVDCVDVEKNFFESGMEVIVKVWVDNGIDSWV